MRSEISVSYNGGLVSDSRYHTFNLTDIDEEYIKGVLSNHFVKLPCQVEKINLQSIEGGFNSDITGGGIFRIVVDGTVGNRQTPSLILKSTPPYDKQKEALFKRLVDLGHSSFISLLDKYPSNNLSERELMSYLFLPGKIPLRMPTLFLGVINEKTEQSWIFMEDLSEFKQLTPEDNELVQKRIKLVLRNMADFHSTFWGEKPVLDSVRWLGRWWSNRNNDYAAEDVAQYAISECAKNHPEILNSAMLAVVNRALLQRRSIHHLFTQEPQTIIHWDFGPQNIRFDESKEFKKQLVVFDWQTTSVGLPQWDIAQFLIPIINEGNDQMIYDLIDYYLSELSEVARDKVDISKFKRSFDLVVLDHFFRVCGPVLLSGKSIDNESEVFLEWKNCLHWIETKSAKWI